MDFEACLVATRCLARRPDEQPREHVRQRGMVLPIRDDRRQQIRPPQERALRRRHPAQHDVIAAAGAGVLAVQHELLGGEARRMRVVVERRRVRDDLVPALRRLHVDFDHARIRRHFQNLEARIVRRAIALDVHRHADRPRRILQAGQQRRVVVHAFQRRHEDAQRAVARLDHQCRAHGFDRLVGWRGLRSNRLCRNGQRLHQPARPDPAAAARSPSDRAAARAENPQRRSAAATPTASRKPAGESPGTSTSLSRRSCQRSVTHFDLRFLTLDIFSGST